jgi:hypothetical protein
MHVFKCCHLDINNLVLQESFETGKKILFCVALAQNLGKLVNTAAERLLDPIVVDLGELVIQALEPWPLVSAEDEDEGRKVEGCVIANVLVGTCLSSVNIEVDDLAIDVSTLVEGSNKWPNVLEGRTSHQLGCGILQEPVVDS